MTRATTKADSSLPQNETKGHLFDNWNDPLETEIRCRIRGLSKSLFTRSLTRLWHVRATGGRRRTARVQPILQALRVTGMEAVRAR